MRHEPIDNITAILNFELGAALRHPACTRTITDELQVPVYACGACGLVGASAIEPDGQFFTPADEGPLAVIMPVFDGMAISDNIVDLTAWYPREPGKWWARTGIAWGLGEQFAEPPFWDDDPIKVFRTPMSWLAASGQGICLLERENAWEHLGPIPKIAAEDKAHGLELQGLLTPPVLQKPKIMVPAS